jgi:ATP:ADP antiporter, AAA family
MPALKKRFTPLVFISFFLAFNYFILKALKESLLVTAQDAGAEVIPFVKMWLLFPASMVFLGAFTWMASRISFRFAVTTIISFFLSSYALFAFVCYPYRESLHLHAFADQLQQMLPLGWRGLVAVVRYWSYSLFYVTAECWCTMIYSVVFWGYANAVTKLHDAKDTYPYLTLAGTIAAVVAGPLAIFLTGDYFTLKFSGNVDSFDSSFYSLTTVVLISGIAALLLFQRYCPEVAPSEQSVEKQDGFFTSFANVFRSPYLMTLAAIGLTYNLVINLSDVMWKNEVLKLYPDPKDFTSYLSYVTLATGIISTLFTLFVCRPSLRRYGWTKTALLTPIITLITGILFFLALFYSEFQLYAIPLSTIIFLGSVHISFSCGGKYTLFEPTKEIAFIPLSQSEKLHGKAAIDGVGARVGKTGSSLIYQTLLILVPTVSACAPFIALLVITGICLCIRCVLQLGQRVDRHMALHS